MPDVEGHVTGRPATGTLTAQAATDSDTKEREQLLAQYHRERARRSLVLDSIRAHFDEQPSPRAVRACLRNWTADLLALAERVAKDKAKDAAHVDDLGGAA